MELASLSQCLCTDTDITLIVSVVSFIYGPQLQLQLQLKLQQLQLQLLYYVSTRRRAALRLREAAGPVGVTNTTNTKAIVVLYCVVSCWIKHFNGSTALRRKAIKYAYM